MCSGVSVGPWSGELLQPNVDAERTQFGDEGLVVNIAAGRLVPVPGDEAQQCAASRSHLKSKVLVNPAQASGCSRSVTSNLVRPRFSSDDATRSAMSCATASVVVSVPTNSGCSSRLR